MDAISSSATSHHLLQCAGQQQLAYAPVTCNSVLVASADYFSPPSGGGGGARRHHQHLAPAGARAGKRRSRASKRAPTTYISTDPSNFRLMVQHITGVQQADPSLSLLDNPLLMTDHHHQQEQQPPCFPTLDSWNVSML